MNKRTLTFALCTIALTSCKKAEQTATPKTVPAKQTVTPQEPRRSEPKISVKVENDSILLAKTAEQFRSGLQNSRSLSSLFSDSWTFVYHEDNRADGSFDGTVRGLEVSALDSALSVPVIHTALEDAPDDTSQQTFSLKEKLSTWNRCEISSGDLKSRRIFLLGGGESDYIVLTLKREGSEFLVDTMEYRSEDPG